MQTISFKKSIEKVFSRIPKNINEFRRLETQFRIALAKKYYDCFKLMMLYGIFSSIFVFFVIIQAHNTQFEFVRTIISIVLMTMMAFSLIIQAEYVGSRIIKNLEEYGAIEQYNFLKTSGKANIVLLIAYVPFFLSLGLQSTGIEKQLLEAILFSTFSFMVFIFPFAFNSLKPKKVIKTSLSIIEKLDEIETQDKIKMIDVWNLIIKKIDLNCKKLFRTHLGIHLEKNATIYDLFKVSTLAYIIGNKKQKGNAKKWISFFANNILNEEITNEEKVAKILKHIEQHQDDEDYNHFLNLSKKHNLHQKYASKWERISQRFGKNEAIITFAISTIITIIALIAN